MLNKPITTDEQLRQCIDMELDVVIWLFGKCEGMFKITKFTKDSVKADSGIWYVRYHCKIFS